MPTSGHLSQSKPHRRTAYPASTLCTKTPIGHQNQMNRFRESSQVSLGSCLRHRSPWMIATKSWSQRRAPPTATGGASWRKSRGCSLSRKEDKHYRSPSCTNTTSKSSSRMRIAQIHSALKTSWRPTRARKMSPRYRF